MLPAPWIFSCPSYLAMAVEANEVTAVFMNSVLDEVCDLLEGLVVELRSNSVPASRQNFQGILHTGVLGKVRVGLTRRPTSSEDHRLRALGPRLYIKGVRTKDWNLPPVQKMLDRLPQVFDSARDADAQAGTSSQHRQRGVRHTLASARVAS